MKKSSTIFLQVLIILIGIGVLTFMLWEPRIEGVNARTTTLYQIYFDDSFLAFVYIASIPFFVTLYQAFKALGYARQNKTFSMETVEALRIIKYCTLSIIGFVAVGEIFISLNESDDRAGGVFMGILIIPIPIAVATAAAKLERFIRKSKTNHTH